MIPELYYHPTYTGAIDDEARFPKARYRLVREALEGRGLMGRVARPVEPRRATREELQLVHDPDYVDAFVDGELDDDQIRRIGFRPWTDAFVERTLRLTGGTIQAFEHLADGASVAGNLAGGTHHAFRDAGAGYCVFNDLAVCARRALLEGLADEVVVVDLDVHQADGTAALFEDEPRVGTYSIHCAANFPFRKETSDHDVPVPEGAGDSTYLDALEDSLPAFLDSRNPGVVFLQGGVDALAADAHGRLDLTRRGLRRRNRFVLDQLEHLDVPLLVTMGGGYAEPIEESVEAHADLFEMVLDRTDDLGAFDG